jgi:hypothetical protein
MKKYIITIAVGLFANCLFSQGKLSRADVATLDFKSLAVNKNRLKKKDLNLLPAYNNLIGLCEKKLKFGPFSVMDKKDTPPSGDKHDYMSLAPYWWPDSSVKGGIPYIRKDGQVNPEVNNFPDKENMPKVCEKVYELSLGFYFSDNEKYAKKAATLIRVWFLDSATQMNPNVNFGQAVKGRFEGRGEGLIDTRHFIYLLDGVKLLSKSNSWTKKDNEKLKNWFRAYYKWMNNSKNGLDEKNAPNNHGIWYDAQSLAITNYLDSIDESKLIIKRAIGRLAAEMDSNGAFPQELARTNSLHYSVFILNAFESIAQLSDEINIDFRNAKLSNGMSLSNAYNFLTPYLVGKKQWTWPVLRHYDNENAFPLLLSASKHNNCTECLPFVFGSSPENKKLLLKLL